MSIDPQRRKQILSKLAAKSLSNAPSGVAKNYTKAKAVAQPGHYKNLNSEQVKRILKRKKPSRNEYTTPGMA